MPGKINKILNLVGNMGGRYIAFRARYEILRRFGLLKRKFPAFPQYKQYVTLEKWKAQSSCFFFRDKESLSFLRVPKTELKDAFEQIRNGKLLLFNSLLTDLGVEYDWVTNPDSGFKYDVQKHWTEIADFSKEAGDIKFVWEKSRFSYLYDIIRFDYHFNEDCAEMVFRDITSWIKGNPVNCGPNYRCSQEMSLRVLNWTFALHYYRNSPFLTEEVFNQIQYAIYWHLDHIYKNIDFSRIAVRNNHAITETLTLYLAGIFYPGLPGADTWKKKGKEWFEKEIAYQVYEDGTFLQFSMNYHRIVVQLLTWGIALSEKNGEKFSDLVYDRAKKSLYFLRTCMVDENGWLPNYGANDGALFFKLSDSHYRDYKPQLQSLGLVLGIDLAFDASFEDADWYGIKNNSGKTWKPANGPHCFPNGGYYLIREQDTLTFIKCGSYKDRPSQADNLHLDVWYKGENILIDAGSYKYNTDDETIRYFSGTRSHNTVMIGSDNAFKDQMLKGGRFIWYYWTQCKEAILNEGNDSYSFSGKISAFSYIGSKIVHERKVIKKKGYPEWTIIDTIPQVLTPIVQLWHYPKNLNNAIQIKSYEDDEEGGKNEIIPKIQGGWYSSLYGRKEKSEECSFTAENKTIETTITVMQS